MLSPTVRLGLHMAMSHDDDDDVDERKRFAVNTHAILLFTRLMMMICLFVGRSVFYAMNFAFVWHSIAIHNENKSKDSRVRDTQTQIERERCVGRRVVNFIFIFMMVLLQLPLTP